MTLQYDKDDKNQHFYAVCVFGWATNDNLFACLEKLSKAYKRYYDKGKFYVAVYHVPAPNDTAYPINEFIPRDPNDESKPFPGLTKVYEGYMP